MQPSQSRRRGLHPRVYFAALVLGAAALAWPATRTPAVAAEPPPQLGDLSSYERADVLDLIRDELEWTIAQQQPIEGQGPDLRLLDISLSEDMQGVVANLTSDFVQDGYDHIGGSFEDQMRQLSHAVHEPLIDQVAIMGVAFLYDGKDIYFYFPDERPEVIWERARSSQPHD